MRSTGTPTPPAPGPNPGSIERRSLVARMKVGTLEDPGLFGTSRMAIYTVDKQAFHQITEGVPAFERLPAK